ncbi:MAG TPA: hypothetical protein VHL34_24990 [Rhizomicrobium sp.]|jgi:hypothetical protein|nr:hypothetical protein [Rhizomicrobium sp.]
MLIARYATPLEEAALTAWDEYALASQRELKSLGDDKCTDGDREILAAQTAAAHGRFLDAYRLLNEPTPEPLRIESGRLCAEGLALLAATGWAVILLVPAIFELHAWTVLAALIVAAGLGAWTVRYLGRLGQHIGRRL